MKSHFILLVSIAIVGVAAVSDGSPAPGAQVAWTAQETTKEQPSRSQGDSTDTQQGGKMKNTAAAAHDKDRTLTYVVDVSKKSTRGYDENGRQEVVNVGPTMKATAAGQATSRMGPRGRQRGAVLPHRYIVRLKNGADFSSLDIHSKVAEHNRLVHLQQQEGQERVEQEPIPNEVNHEYDFGTWKGYAGQFSIDFLKELESHHDVEYVEEDTMMWAWDMNSQHKDAIGATLSSSHEDGSMLKIEGILPNVTNIHFEYLTFQAPSWGLTRISQRQRDLKKDYSYMSTAGLEVDIGPLIYLPNIRAGVDVYIIDTGVFEGHSDFEGRASNLVNFVSGEEESDTCGHGTHVAGIVGGRRYGVAKAATLLAIKVLDSDGQGSTSQILAGINYVIRHAINNPNSKKIVNMSLGGQFSRLVNEAVRAAVTRHNLPFIVAAGNNGDDACQYSPAGVEEAFAVGGTDRSDRVGWYSCVGPCVNIFAPGSSIVSDWIYSSTAANILDGTSMAAPHVAGVAALYMGSGRTYTRAQDLYDDLIRHSTPDAVTGLSLSDGMTTRNLLFNKMEDVLDM
ncbi:serine protease [Mortierella claussenii]|nr:serine protease [Mortierella claussenii]